MTGMSRKIGLVFVLSVLAAAPSSAQDIQATFDEGVDLMRRGRDEEALRAFERVLAADPSNEDAYQLFKRTEHEVWIQILSKKGDMELVARRLMGLASLGRLERRDDAEAIRALVGQLSTDDAVSRISATRQLAAEHGEYAVPYMLPALADSGNESRRTAVMVSLAEMGLDVVPPMIEALDAPDAFLRRNVALTLGRIKDLRAVPMLAQVAASDPDTGARQAAQEALAKLGNQGAKPAAAFVLAGHDYVERRDTVLAPHMYSNVVWRWEDRGLAKTAIAREIYPEAMARKCFARALASEPGSAEALAGFVRAQVGAMTKLEILAAAGRDVGEFEEYVHSGSAAVGYAGLDATDRALQSAVASGDVAAALGLVAAVRAVSGQPTPGLQAALSSNDGSLRSAAAIALGHLAVDSRSGVSAEVVNELARAVSREIVRIAFLIDANEERALEIAAGLRGQGMLVSGAKTGGMGLAMMGRLPGVDLVLVADRLPDLTAHQVLTELAEDQRFAGTPRLVITDDAERAGELYGEKAAGVVAGGDVSGVPEVLGDGLQGDREKADRLSQAAALTLSDLASAGADLSAALDALAGTLAARPDAVAVPASHALERAGTGAQIPALVAVVADSTRSDEVRSAAAGAIAMIVARGAGTVSAEGISTLRGVAESDAARSVRMAAARAVGVSAASAAARAEMIHAAIVPPAAGGGEEE